MTQNITAKPKTVQEAIDYFHSRYPQSKVFEATVRDILGLEEDEANPPGLTEAVEAFNKSQEPDPEEQERQRLETEAIEREIFGSPETENTPPNKTTISESERVDIIQNFRASYPFRNNVTDDEIIKEHIQTASITPLTPITPQKIIQPNPTPEKPIQTLTTLTTSKTPISNEYLAPSQLNTKIFEQRRWASQKRGETADDYYDNQFYRDPKLMAFIEDIADFNNGLYVITGFSGSGKSLALKIIAQELTDFHESYHLRQRQRVVVWKPINGKLTVKEVMNQIVDGLPKQLKQELREKIERNLPKGTESCRSDDPLALSTYLTQLPNPEKILAKYLMPILATVDFLLVDLSDYSGQAEMNKGIKKIEELWNEVNKYSQTNINGDEPKLNIIYTTQKELFDESKQFFNKKPDMIYTIKPIEPAELAKYYIERFETRFPFTEEALNFIAANCGGNMRKLKSIMFPCFNNYRRQCSIRYDEAIHKTVYDEITVQMVKEWVGTELFASDSLDFTQLSSSKRQQHKAAEVIRYLQQNNNEAYQRDITVNLFGSDQPARNDSTEIFQKLEKIGFVISEFRNGLKYIRIRAAS